MLYMKYLRAFRRPIGLMLMVLMLTWQIGQPLRAANIYWDNDATASGDNSLTGAGLGGTGTWDTTSSKWWNLTSDNTWNNANNDTAVFWGTAGTVTLGTGITVGGLTFDTTAYTLTGNTLTFGAATNTITLNNIAAATIASTIAGSNALVVSGGIYGGLTAGTVTLSGAGSSFTGTTTINNGMTLSLSGGTGTALSNTTGITLNGGGITLTNANSTDAALNRVANGAGITSNGGTITFTNTSGSVVYAETVGSVALTSGQMNLVEATNQASTGSQTLTLSGLTRTGATNTSAVTFASASGLNTTKNIIVVTGATATTAGQIIGPWATVGTTAALQTDYAVYNASSQVVAAGIAGSLESTWTTAANAYTNSSAAQTLSATRTITALLNTGATSTLTLASGANLQTYGLLNGVATTFTVAPGTGGSLTTPSGGGNLFVNTGSAAITISAPITDNSGAVTLVRTGTGGTLTLSSTSNSYSGGTVIDAGVTPSLGSTGTVALSIGADSNLGATSGGITFNSSGTLAFTASMTLNAARTITINNSAMAKFTEAAFSQTIPGKITGTGGLILDSSSGNNSYTLSNTSNDFQGPLIIGFSSNIVTASVASLADSATANGAIRLLSTTGSGVFQWSTAATTALVLNNRQVDITGATAGGTGAIDSSNGTAANTVTVNTDLLVSATAAKTLSLQGTNTGANTFAGRIADGASAVISLSKSGAGNWTISGTDTYSGTTTVSAGTLTISGNMGGSTSAATITGGTLLLTGTGPTGAVTVNSTGLYKINGAAGLDKAPVTVNFGGTLTIDNTTASGGVLVNRLSSQNLTLAGGVFNYNSGGSSAAATDSVGTLTINAGGTSTISLTANSAGATSVSATSLVRNTGGVLLVTGTNLGAAPGANNTNLIITANGTGGDVVGGTGAAGSTSISINPFILGQDTALAGSAQYGFMTDKINGSILANGLRLLTASEYAATITSGTSGLDNVGLGSAVSSINAATTINSLRVGAGGTVSGSGTLTINSGAVLAVSGANYSGIAVGTLAFGSQEAIIQTAGGDLNISSSITGSAGLNKNGSGVLTLSGSNAFTGPITINAGVLRAGSTSAFGTGGANSVTMVNLAGVILDLAGFNNSVGSLTGGNAVGGVSLRGGTLTVGGDNTSTTFSGLIYGSGGLVKTGTGTLTLSTANTFAGSTTISSGTLKGGIAAFLPAATALTVNGTLDLNALAVTLGQFSGSGIVTNSNATAVALTLGNFAGNFDTTFSGVFNSSTPASLTLTKTGGGTLTLTSAAGTATGAWTLNAGTIKADYSVGSVTGNIINPVATTLSGGSINITGRSGATVTQTLGAITLGARGGQITMVSGGGGGSTTLTLGALTATAAGGAMLVTAPSGTTVTFATAADTTTPTGILGAGRLVFTDGTTGYNWATNTGSGTATTGVSSYTTLVASGSTSTVNYLQTDTLAGGITAAETINTLKITDTTTGGTLALGANILTIATGGLLYTGANGYTISSSTGSLKNGLATNPDFIVQQYGTGTLTISAIIADGSAASTLTKAGTGKLVLSGANTYTGGTFVDAGILSVSANTQLGNTATSAITINDGATLQSTATFSTGTHTYSLTGGNATLDIAPSTTLTVNGVISGAGGLTLNDSGTLSITAAATYTGPTYVNSGTLLGGVATFINAATGGNLNVGASGLVDMNNFTLTVGGIAGAGNIKNSGASAQTLTVGGNNQNTVYSGVLQPTGTTAANLNLAKNGTGMLTLNSASLYTGTTTVNNGTIQWGVDNALTSTTVITLGNAAGPITAVLDLNGHAQTLAGPTLYGTTSTATSQAIINIGTGGNLTLAGNLTETVNATASNGFLGAFIQGGTLTMTAVRTFSIADSINAAADLTVTSAIAGTGGGITKTGAGNLVLAGVNTTTGANIVQVGTLTAGVNGALSSAGTWTVTATGAAVTAILDISGTVQSLNSVLTLGGSTTTSAPVVNLSGGTLSVLGGITYTSSNNPLTGQINGGDLDLGSATRTITVGNSTSQAVDLSISSVISGAGGLTIAGVGQLLLSGQSTYAGNTTLSAAGIVQAGVSNALPYGVGKGNLIINAGTFDLNGYNTNLNAVTAAAAGGTIDNTSGNGATLTVGNSDTTGTIYAGTISNSGTGALNLTKTGAGVETFTGAVGIKGALAVNGGTLNVFGALTNAASMTGVSVAGGTTLNLIGSAATALPNLTTLNLGAGSGTATLDLTLGATASSLTSSTAATTANSVALNLTALSGLASGTYTLLSAPSGLSGATYQISAVGGFATTAQSISDTAVSITLGSATSTALYWNGGVDGNWNTLNGSLQSNWTDATGTVNSQAMPGYANTAIFSASGQSGTTIATTLGMNVTINDLQFNSAVGRGPVSSITIASGANAANTLTIAPSSSSVGITVQTGAPASISISAPVNLGASQTWTVADAATTLNVSGVVSGTAGTNLNIAGSGTVTLSSAGNLFGGAATTINVQSGTLQFSADAQLGSSSNTLSIGTSSSVGTLAFTGTTLTEARNIALGTQAGSATGDTISAPSGTVLTLSGVISGGAAASVAGNDSLTITGGGTVILSGNNTFTGDVIVAGNSTLSVNTILTTLNLGTAVINQKPKQVFIQNGSTYIATASQNPVAYTVANSVFYSFGQNSSSSTTLNVANASTFQLDDAGQLTLNGTLNVTGNGTFFIGTQDYSQATASFGSTSLTTGVMPGSSINVSGTATLSLRAGTNVLGSTYKVPITLNTGTTLDLELNSGGTFGNNLTIAGDATLKSGRTTAASTNITQTMGSLTVGSNTVTAANGANNTAPGVANLAFTSTTLTGSPTFNLTNVNGTGIGTLSLGVLNDGGTARTMTLTTTGSASALSIGGSTASTYSGIINVTNGTYLVLAGAGATGTGTVNVTNGYVVYSANSANSGGTVNVGDTSGSNPATLAVGADGVTISNPFVLRDGSSGTTTITTVTTATQAAPNALGFGMILNGVGTISAPITIAKSSGAVNFGAAASTTLVITGAVGESGGSKTFNATGPGTIYLLGDKNFTGGINLTGGALILGTGPTSANFSGTTTINGGLLGLVGSYALPGGVTIGGSGGSLLYAPSGPTTDYSASLTLTSGGTLTLDIASGLTVTYATAFGGSTSAGLSKSGGGTLNLSPASGVESFTGATTVGAGTLALNFVSGGTTSNIINSGSILQLQGGTLTVNGGTNASAVSQTFASTSLQAGNSTITLTKGSASTEGLTLGTITRSAGAAVNFSTIPASTSVNIAGNSNNSAGILGGWAVYNGTDWAVNNGSNLVAAYASYTTLATTGGGTLSTTNFNEAASITLTAAGGASITANSLKISSGTFTLALGANNSLTLNNANGGILIPSTSTTSTISGTPALATGLGMVSTGTASGGELPIYVNTGATLVISAGVGGIAGSTNGFGITKNGGGTLQLTNATTSNLNNYIGATVINGGVLLSPAPGGLNGSSGITLNGGTLSSGNTTNSGSFTQPLTLGLSGGTLSYNSTVGTGSGNGGWSSSTAIALLGSGSRTLTLTGTDTDRIATLVGALGDGGGPTSLIVSGGTTTSGFQLNGTNTYSGSTTLLGGDLILNNASALPSLSALTFSGSGTTLAQIEMTATSGTSFTRSLGTGPGQVQWLGNGGFSAGTGTNTAAGITVNLGGAGATVTWGSGGFVPSGSILSFNQNALNNPSIGAVNFLNGIDFGSATTRTIDVENSSYAFNTSGVASNNAAYDAQISGSLLSTVSGGFTKTGTGVLWLSGNNSSFLGNITVANGTVLFGSTSALPGSLTLTQNTSLTAGAVGGAVLQGATNFNSLYAITSTSSAGELMLDTSSSENINFNAAGFSNARFGAFGNVLYNGQFTPGTAGAYLLNGTSGNLVSAEAGQSRLFLPRTNALTGAGSTLNVGAGVLFLGSSNNIGGAVSIQSVPLAGTNSASGAAFVWIANNNALGTGTITLTNNVTSVANQEGYVGLGAAFGDHTLANNIIINDNVGASGNNFTLGGDTASDNVPVAGRMTYSGNVTIQGSASSGNFQFNQRTTGLIFNGQITSTAPALLFYFNGGGSLIEFNNLTANASNYVTNTIYLNSAATFLIGQSSDFGDTATARVLSWNSSGAVFGILPTAGNVTTSSNITFLANGNSFNQVLDVPLASQTFTLTSGIIQTSARTGQLYTKTGLGTFDIGVGLNPNSGASTWGTAGITISQGTLSANFTTSAVSTNTIRLANSSATPAPLTLSGGTLLLTGKNAATNSQAFGALTVNQGPGAITMSTSGGGTLSTSFTSMGTRAAGGTVALTFPSGGPASMTVSSGLVAQNGLLVDASTTKSPFMVVGTQGGSITDWAAVSGTSIVAFSAYTPTTSSTISGSATVTTGTDTTLTANAAADSLRFNLAETRTINLGGNTLNVGGVLVTSAVTGNASTITGGSLSTASGASAGADLVIYQADTSAALNIGASIVDNSGNSVALTKSGLGELVLSAANTFSGSMNFNEGTVTFNAVNRLGSGAGALNLNGAVLHYTGAADTGSAGTLTNGSVNVTRDSTVSVDTGATLTMSGTVTSTLLSPTYEVLTKTGSGTLVLGGSSNNVLQVDVAQGTLVLNKSGGNVNALGISQINILSNVGLTVESSALAQLGGDTASGDQILNSSSVQLNGTGILDMAGHSETIDGLGGSSASFITNSSAVGAVLTVGSSSMALGAPTEFDGTLMDGAGTLGLTMIGGNIFTLTGINTYTGKTTITGQQYLTTGVYFGGISISSEQNLGGNPANFTPDQWTLNGGRLVMTGNVTLGAARSNVGITLGTGGGIFEVASSMTFSIAAANVITGTGGFTKEGAGAVVMLGGANTYTGKTILNAGSLSISAQGALGSNPSSLTADQLTLNGGQLITTATLSLSDSNRGVSILGYGGTLTPATGTTLTLPNLISGTGNLTLNGSGTVVLGGASTSWTGKTILQAGELQISNNLNLGSPPAAAVADQLQISNNANFHLTAGMSFNANRGVTIGTGGATITADASTVVTINGSITLNAGTLTKAGAGVLALAGTDTGLSGTQIAVTAGVLRLASGGALPSSSNVSLSGGGVIELASGDFSNASGTGANQIQWTGSGGFGASGGARNVNIGGLAATMVWNSGSFVPTGSALVLSSTTSDSTVTFQNAIDLNGAVRTIQVNNGSASTDAVISAPLMDSGSGGGLVKTGAGTLSLTGGSSYAGTTEVSGGTLAAGAANVLASSSAFTLDNTSGVVLDLSSNNQTIGSLAGGGASGGNVSLGSAVLTTGGNNTSTVYSGVISGTSGGLTKVGTGNMSLTSAQAYTGATTVNGGGLFVNSTLATSGVSVGGSGTLGGSGSISALTTVSSGGTIQAGDVTSSGSLALSGGLTFLGAGAISVGQIAEAAPNILNIGALTVGAAAGAITVNVISNSPSGYVNGTPYTLFTYTGGSILGTAGFSAFQVGTIAGTNSRTSGILSDTGSAITLTLTADNPKWTGFDTTSGLSSSRWAVNDTLLTNPVTDWKLSGAGTPTSYLEGDVVLFDDTAIGSKTVDISDGDVNPSSVTFNNSAGAANTYTITGTHGIAGSANLTKSGAGTLIIDNTNSFNGGVILNGGVIQLGTSGALGTTNGLIFGASVAAGTKLQLNSNSITLTGLNTNAAPGSAVVENGGSSNATLTLNLQISGAAPSGDPTSTFAGTLQDGSSGSLGLALTGNGILTLTGASTYTGLTTISSGTLQIGAGGTSGSIAGTGGITNNAALIFDRSDSYSYTGNITGTGTTEVSGGGILTLTGSLGSTGGTTIDTSNTLNIGTGGAGGAISGNILDNGALKFNTTSTGLVVSGSITGSGTLENIAGVTILAGANNFGSGSSTTITGGTLQIGNGGTTGSITGNILDNGVLAFSRSDSSTFAGSISGSGSVLINMSSSTAVKTLSGTNSYGGGVTVAQGVLALGSSTAVPSGSAVTVGATGTSGTLDLNGFNLTVSSLNTAGTASSQTIINNSSTTNSVLTYNSAASSTFGGLISNGASRNISIVVTGGGLLSLASTNSFTGGVSVLNGTIQLGADGALGTGAITLGTTGSNGVLDLNSFNQTVSSLAVGAGAVAGSQIIGNSSTVDDGYLTINGTSTFGGLIQDTLGAGTFRTGLTIASGTTTLTNANTYTGATQINSGATLQLGSGGTTGSLSNGTVITDNGTLSFNRTDYVTFGATVSGSGGLQQLGSGVLELTGSNSYSGLTVMNNASGTLKTSGTNSSATGGTTLTAGTLLLNNSGVNNGGLAGGTITISGGTIDNISGSALALVGNNNMNLGGSFTFTGSNDLNFGSGAVNVGVTALTITVGGTSRTLSLGALTNTTGTGVNTITVNGAGNTLVLGSYALSNNSTSRVDVINGTSNIIINGALTNGGTSTAGGLNYSGTGTITLNGASSYGGLTTLTTGTIIFNGSNSGTGGTTLTAGTMQLGGSVNGGIASGTLTLTAGTLQAINAARTISNATTMTTVTVSGSQSLTINGAFTIVNSAHTLTSSITGGNVLTLGGNVFLSDSATVAGAATVAGSGLTTISGNIANFNGSGLAGTLTITNTSTTTLGGANTYSGLTTMNASTGILVLAGSNNSAGATTLTTGTIQFNSSSALGGGSGLGSGLLTLTAGTLQALNAARTITSNALMTAVTVSGSQNLTMNGSFTFVNGSRTLTSSITGGNLLTLGGSVYLSDSATVAGTQTIAGSGLTTISGNIADFNGSGLAGSLTITNTSTTTLAGANTYSGTTTMNASGGTLVFSGSNSSAGATTLTTGTLQFNSGSNGGLASGLLTFTAGTVQAINAARSVANAISLTAVTVSGSQNLTFNGKITGLTGASRTLTNNITAGSTLTLTSIDINTETANARSLTIAGTGATTITGAVGNGNGTTANSLTISNTNTTTFTAAAGVSTLSGTITEGAGTLVIGATNTLPVGAAFVLGTLATGGAAGTLDITSYDQTVGSFSVSSDNATADRLLTSSGRTLTVNGNVVIGSTNASLTNTSFTASGGGSLVVNNLAASGTFRVGGSSASGNLTTADLSGLSNLTVSLNTTNGLFEVASTSGTNISNTYSVLTLATNNTITAKTFAVGDGGQYNGSIGQLNQLKLGTGTNAINADIINIGTGARDFGSVTFSTGTGSIVIRASDGVSRAAFNMGAIGGATGVATATGMQNTFDVTGHSADLLFAAVSIGTQATRGDTLTNVFSFDTGVMDMTSLTMSVKTGTPLAGVPLVNSTVNLGGGSVTIDNGILQMGQTSTATNQAVATINVTGGTVVIGATSGTAITMASAGAGTSATATLNLTGGTTTINGNIVKAGGAGTTSATVNLNGGTLDMAGNSIGSSSQNVTLTAASGTLQNLGELNGGGSLTKTTAGTLVLAGNNTYTGKTVVTAGTVAISSETNLGANPGTATPDQLTLNGGTLETTATLAINDSNRGVTVGASGGAISTDSGTTATVSNVVTGNGTLAKEGAGTLIFTAVNTNTGSTEVYNGTLGGTGTIGGDLNVHAGGSVAPGIAAEGMLTVNGNLTVSSGGTLVMQLGGATTNDASTVQAQMAANGNLLGLVGSVPSAWTNYVVGTTLHDNILVNGSAAPTINGTLVISSSLLYGYTPAYGDVFKLIDWNVPGSIAGSTTFDYTGVALAAGLSFNTDLFASSGVIVVVPEPSRALFLLFGLLAFCYRRRRSAR